MALGHARAQGLGGARRRRRRASASTTTPPAGWPSPTPDQLDQVLWALLDNAVKYGAAHVRSATTVVADAPASQVRLTIADGGPGVAEADRERLFARFARGGEAAPDGGSGLGLYVSRELCRAMGGDLVLEPAVAGRGAAFTVVLPGEPGEEG